MPAETDFNMFRLLIRTAKSRDIIPGLFMSHLNHRLIERLLRYKVSARKGVTCRRLHGITVGNDPGISDPRAICTGSHLQKAVEDPVAAHSHQEIPAELFADAPVDDGYDDQRRAFFT